MKYIIVIALLALLGACASTKLTPNDDLQIGYGLVETIVQDTDALYSAKVITEQQAQNIEKQAANLKAALDVASAAVAANQASAGNAVATTVAALNALNATLLQYSAKAAQ